jgi:hypothetical protein
MVNHQQNQQQKQTRPHKLKSDQGYSCQVHLGAHVHTTLKLHELQVIMDMVAKCT